MPRSASEATRFTSTGPHVSSKAGIATTIDISGRPNPNETPAQKVARLREAARRARTVHETTWDRVVSRGRIWADRAHRITTSSLIIASIVATGFAAVSVGEMITSNRRKKRDWIKEQESNYQRALDMARKAEEQGTLTDSLRMFLVKERAIQQAEAEKAGQESLWSKAKKSMFGGLALEERPRGRLLVDPETLRGPLDEHPGAQPTTRADRTTEMSPEVITSVEEPEELRVADDIRRQLRPNPTRTLQRGGPLDQIAEETSASISATSQRIFNIISRR